MEGNKNWKHEDMGQGNGIYLSLVEAMEKSKGTLHVMNIRDFKKMVLAIDCRLPENLEAHMKYVNHLDKFSD